MRQLKIKTQITNRNDNIDKYLSEIAKFKLLSTDEEIELAVRIRAGDKKALDTLVNSNLRFVISVAKQYANSSPRLLSELINEGNIGLIQAAGRYDETRGFKFISYAVWWIRQSILSYLSSNASIFKTAGNVAGKRKKINDFSNIFFTKNGRMPEVFEISEALEITEDSIKNALSITDYISGDSTISKEDDNATIFDITAELDNDLSQKINNEHANTVLTAAIEYCMTKREAFVIKGAFGINTTAKELKDIADDLGLSKERTRQIKERAIKRLRHYFLTTKPKL